MNECRCGHGREWHDPCSQCFCPFFLDPENEGPVKRWEREKRGRERREKAKD